VEEYIEHDEPKILKNKSKTKTKSLFLTHPFNSSSINSINGIPLKSSFS